MSFLKGLALVIISMLFVVFLVLFQVDNTINSTVLSSGYFNSTFDKNVTGAGLKNFAEYLKDNVGDVGNEDMKKIVQDAIDVRWFQEDMPALLKGCFAYFTTGDGELPAINIVPMKDAMAKAIANKAGAASALVESQIGLSKMKDKLDLNQILFKMYGNNANPVSAFGDIIRSVRGSFFTIIVITALLLFAIIAIMAYRLRVILKWSGACLIMAGALCVLPALVPILFHTPMNAQVVSAIGGGEELSFLQDWAVAYIEGVASFMLVQGFIVVAVGIVFLILAGFAAKEGARYPEHNAVRAAVAVMLLLAIPVSGYFILRDLYPHVKDFNNIRKIHEKITFGKAFDATMGGSLGEIVENMD